MAVARRLRTGRVGRRGLGTELLNAQADTSKLSHRARRRIAAPPMAKIERAVTAVGEALQRWGDALVARVMRDVVPVVRSIPLVQDATVDQVYASLDQPEVARRTLEETFRAVDKASSDDLRVMGVQTSSVVREAPRLQREWLRSSTDLIRAQEDVRRRVEQVISDPVTSGMSVEEIRKALQEQVGYSRSRAELTARDQTLKLYGRIQEERQTAAGFTHYVWTTSLDERVREDHAALDGKVFAWDDPPIVDRRTGRRAHPGFDYQCRCSAVPVPNAAPAVREAEEGSSLPKIAAFVAAEQFVTGFAYEALRTTAVGVEVSARVVSELEGEVLGIQGVLESAERGIAPRALPAGARPPLQLTEGAPRVWEEQIEAFRRQGERALEGRPASLSEREPMRPWWAQRPVPPPAREPLIRRPTTPVQAPVKLTVHKPTLKEADVPKWVRGNTRVYLSWLIDNPGATLTDLKQKFGRDLHGTIDRLVDRGVVFRGKARDGSKSWAKGLYVEQRYVGKAGVDDSLDRPPEPR